MDYLIGECEWAVFRNGEMWTDSLSSIDECLEHIEECISEYGGEYEYRLITEEERTDYF